MSRLAAFLAGDHVDDIAIVLSDGFVENREALEGHAESVDGGLALVLPGERGRAVFERVTGSDPMAFARAANREGRVDRDLAGGDCPEGDGTSDHHPAILLAFAESRNEEAGGLYAEGDVIHAYVRCACGTRYSDRWVADA